MDNVTQRQNHISGLSEGFTYDALDRLTQSSTTGKIDDVDYSYAVITNTTSMATSPTNLMSVITVITLLMVLIAPIPTRQTQSQV
ncbi:hypothetical protein BSPWISOXPB_3597 [uncultured Gammaproteobacteria bacterium]|nr:hypothetical protein BSPWISOXPB_3597 [uncultured Gammaproteobacteria bacterium]